MTDRDNLFFELIQVALGVRPCLSRTPNGTEWGELYKIAKKQSLVGVCFAGVQRLLTKKQEPPEMLYLTWMGMAAKIQQRNEVVNRQCVELQAKLTAVGFRSYIMKGQANASLYKLRDDSLELIDLSALRQSGDIDVYLEGGLDRVLAYARTYGNVEHVNELEMSVPVFPDTEVEFHYRPFIMRNPWRNRKLQQFFKSQEEACFENRLKLNAESLEIVAPTTEFNLVHQLAHIHLHLFTEGIGMRQLMDYYFVLKSLDKKACGKKAVLTKTEKTADSVSSGSVNLGNDNSSSEIVSKLPSSAAKSSLDANGIEETASAKNIKNICEVVSDLGLNRYASALMWVLGHVFGLERECMLWESNEEDGRLLLTEVMIGGNFGRHNEEQNDRKGKVGYSVWALFFRNLRLSRFDRGDWFWGPLWRISHKLTRKKI